MKYLFSELMETSIIEIVPEGEPVIPCFPCHTSSFITIPSFKHCVLAKVKQVPQGANNFFDVLAKKIIKQYPGIPSDIIEQYIIGTARAASQFPEKTVLRIFVNNNSANVQDIQTEEIFYLWKKQPITREN